MENINERERELKEELQEILENMEEEELLKINNEIYKDYEENIISPMWELAENVKGWEIEDLIALGYDGFNPYDNYFKKWFDGSLNTFKSIDEAINLEELMEDLIADNEDFDHEDIRRILDELNEMEEN